MVQGCTWWSRAIPDGPRLYLMVQGCTKWSRTVPGGPGLNQMVKTVQVVPGLPDGQGCRELSRPTGCSRAVPGGLRLYRMVQGYTRWFRAVLGGSGLYQVVWRDPGCYRVLQGGLLWSRVA